MTGMEIASIVRTQDFSIIKQNEDSKAMLDQSHIGHIVEKKEQNNAQDVVTLEKSQFYDKNPDARERGANEYSGDGGKNRKKKPADRVIVKNQPSGFDFRV